MAFITKTTTIVQQQEGLECEYLDFNKGQFVKWNKEKKENDIHELTDFIILDLGYTVKGKVWDQSINKYTASYFSNEIRTFDETVYLIKAIFGDTTIKELISKGKWSEIKMNKPQGANLNIMIYILDLNDGLVKGVPLSGSNFFNISQTIQKYNKELGDDFAKSVFSIKTNIFYTKGKKDKGGNEILLTLKDLKKLPEEQRFDYKKRYKVELIYNDKILSNDEIEKLEVLESSKKIDDNYKNKKDYYNKTYGDGEGQEQENKYFVPKNIVSEQTKIETKNNISDKIEKQEEDLSVEDIPF